MEDQFEQKNKSRHKSEKFKYFSKNIPFLINVFRHISWEKNPEFGTFRIEYFNV